jgi:ADP-ribose pyrophosphatase YjhB (NUDIX family)
MVLLQRRRAGAHPWILPGGILPARASLEAFATTLAGPTGVPPAWIAQVAALDSGRGCITVGYVAVVGPKQAADTAWHCVRRLPALQAPARVLVQRALECLHRWAPHQALARRLLPREFTLGELQRLHEALAGRVLVRANFRRELAASQLVIATGKVRMPPRGRPAQLFAFRSAAETRTPASRGAGPGNSEKRRG